MRYQSTAFPETRFGIIGATGAIGGRTAEILRSRGHEALLAGRNPDTVMAESGCFRWVNVHDHEAMDDFVAETDVVINCSGPSCETSLCVLKTATKFNRPLVDVGENLLTMNLKPPIPVIAGAGCIPGLSGVAAMAAAAAATAGGHLISVYSVRDIFTPSGAKDFLRGIDRKPAAEIIALMRNPKSLINRLNSSGASGFRALNFPCRIAPYQNEETKRLSGFRGFDDAEWYSALAGGVDASIQLMKIINQYHVEPDGATDDLIAFSRESVSRYGRGVDLLIDFIARDGRHATVSLRGTGQSGLSAAMAAAMAEIIATTRVAPGIWTPAQVTDPRQLLARIKELAPATQLVFGMDEDIHHFSCEEAT
jgi:saccharopine dehydrogenase